MVIPQHTHTHTHTYTLNFLKVKYKESHHKKKYKICVGTTAKGEISSMVVWLIKQIRMQ